MRSEVDFVITFEELAGMFDAKEIVFNTYEKEEELNDAFGAGRGYAVASGVVERSRHVLMNTILEQK